MKRYKVTTERSAGSAAYHVVSTTLPGRPIVRFNTRRRARACRDTFNGQAELCTAYAQHLSRQLRDARRAWEQQQLQQRQLL